MGVILKDCDFMKLTAIPRPWWQRVLLRLARLTLLVLASISGLMLLFQHRLIYHPRPYPPNIPLRAGIERLTFTTAAGKQVCWWVPGRTAGGDTGRVWLCFSGNASQARMWHDFFDAVPSGMLLIEFPGYGESAGNPSPASILDATNGAVEALRQRLGTLPKLGVLGHSLGCAAALQFAAQQAQAGTPVERMVLIAPFTRLIDMAQRVVGWPFCHLLLHRYNNQRTLATIFAQGSPQIDVFHGVDDALIPVSMSRELKAEFPLIRLHEIVGADHNGVLGEVAPMIKDLL